VVGAVGADEEPAPATCIWLPTAPLDIDDVGDVDAGACALPHPVSKPAVATVTAAVSASGTARGIVSMVLHLIVIEQRR
jgi:hypothetical protein